MNDMKLLFLVKPTVLGVGFRIYYKDNDNYDKCYKAVKLNGTTVYLTERSLPDLMSRVGRALKRQVKCC